MREWCALLLLVGVLPGSAYAVCRVIEPISGTAEGVVFDETTSVLVVHVPDQLVDYDCSHVPTPLPEPLPEPARDFAPSWTPGPDEAWKLSDAGGIGGRDGGAGSVDVLDGSIVDGGVADAPLPDGSLPDGSLPDGSLPDGSLPDGSLADGSLPDGGTRDPSICSDGSYATPVRDTLTHVVVQPAVLAAGGRAGLVMPIPRRSDVNLAPPSIFVALQQQLRGTRVREEIEFVEDPSLGFQCSDPHYGRAPVSSSERFAANVATAPLALYGCGDTGSDFYRPGLAGMDVGVVEYEDGETIEYEELPISADYTATVLSASSLDALVRWMDERGLAHDETDDAAFARYVGEGQWFVAIEVHPADVGGELTALQPLVVSWRGADFPITHELTYDPAGGLVETDLWVLAPWKAAVADGDARLEYASSFALHPSDTTLGAFGLSSGWLTRLHLERRMADVEQRDSALVAAEDIEEVLVEGLVTRQLRVRIAQACCAGQKIPTGGARTFHETREYDASSPPSDASYFYSAPDAPNANCPGGEAYDPPYGTSDYDYACSVSSVAASWGPLVLALGLLVRRRRR